MVENRGEVQLDPTPNFDCHVSKTANVDVLVTGPFFAFEATQVCRFLGFVCFRVNMVN